MSFLVFFVLKNTENTENTKLRENQEQFSKNPKMMFSMFLKTFLKNICQKQELNRPLASTRIS